MSSDYKQDWDVYFCYLEDAPAFISVDLGYFDVAPLADKPYLIEIAAGLLTMNDDGFPENEEWEKLEKIEDVLVNSFEAKLEASFVGKTLNSGRRGFYFYSGDTLLVEQMMGELRQQFTEYNFEHQIKEDPGWDVYFEYLYPDEESLLRIQNNKMLRLLEEQGDQAYVPRQITYTLYFRTAEDRKAVADAIVSHDFQVDEMADAAGDTPYKLVLSRESRADEETIYLLTEMLQQMAIQHDGEFDGWETQVVLEND